MNIPVDAVVTVIVFLIGNLAATIWFMSSINTTVNIKFEMLTESVKSIAVSLVNAYTKDDALREIGRVEAIADRANVRLDEHLHKDHGRSI